MIRDFFKGKLLRAHDDEDYGLSIKKARGRLVLLSGFFTVFFLIATLRMFDLAVLQAQPDLSSHRDYTLVADGNDVLRGNIYDRNNVLLATTIEAVSLYADPGLVRDPVALGKSLAAIFPDESYGQLVEKLQNNKRFVWLHRHLTPEEQQAVLALGDPALEFERENRRLYPQGALTAHLVGYSDLDGRGLAGMERSFDGLLGDGRDLTLSMDIRLQHFVRKALSDAVQSFSAKGGAGIVMDVRNGDVLAAVSLPDYNPHMAGEAEDEERFNNFSLGVYELGSVFKIFSTAAYLEHFDVPMNKIFDASKPLKRGRFTISDFHAQDRILTLPEVFMYSSNIGSAIMAEELGADMLRNFYDDLGLLKPFDMALRESGRPLVPRPWREINTITASYGHGLATTPLHIAVATSIVANGGYSVLPNFVHNDTESVVSKKMVQKHAVMAEETSSQMRALLRLSVAYGTGSKGDVHGYRVGGKTGTADKNINGRYVSGKRMSSFVGVFPMDDPLYTVFVVIDEPQATRETFGFATGGWVAAPAVASIITNMAGLLGLMPQEHDIGQELKRYVASEDEIKALKARRAQELSFANH